MNISVFDWVEDILGKGENAGFLFLSFFPIMFSRPFFSKVAMTWVVRETVKRIIIPQNEVMKTIVRNLKQNAGVF